jgi:hypothetical protein
MSGMPFGPRPVPRRGNRGRFCVSVAADRTAGPGGGHHPPVQLTVTGRRRDRGLRGDETVVRLPRDPDRGRRAEGVEVAAGGAGGETEHGRSNCFASASGSRFTSAWYREGGRGGTGSRTARSPRGCTPASSSTRGSREHRLLRAVSAVHAATGSPVMIGIVRPRTGQRDLRRSTHHTGLLLRDLPDLVRHLRRQNDAGGAAGEVDHECYFLRLGSV